VTKNTSKTPGSDPSLAGQSCRTSKT